MRKLLLIIIIFPFLCFAEIEYFSMKNKPRINGEIDFHLTFYSSTDGKDYHVCEELTATLDEKYYGFAAGLSNCCDLEDYPKFIVYDVVIIDENIQLTTAIWKGFEQQNRDTSRTTTLNPNKALYIEQVRS